MIIIQTECIAISMRRLNLTIICLYSYFLQFECTDMSLIIPLWLFASLIKSLIDTWDNVRTASSLQLSSLTRDVIRLSSWLLNGVCSRWNCVLCCCCWGKWRWAREEVTPNGSLISRSDFILNWLTTKPNGYSKQFALLPAA